MQEKEKTSRTNGGWGILLTQTVVCAVVLLVALILRLIGGGAFGWFRGTVNEALNDDSLLTGLSSRIYGTTVTTTTTVEPMTIESGTTSVSSTTTVSHVDG